MPKSSYFYLMFHVDNPVEAYKFYHNAFGVDKISDDMLPNGDHYIMVDINGCNILIRPGEKLMEGNVGCCAKFTTKEELLNAYEILIKEGKDYSVHTEWHWTPLAALVTDKYGVKWLLSKNLAT